MICTGLHLNQYLLVPLPGPILDVLLLVTSLALDNVYLEQENKYDKFHSYPYQYQVETRFFIFNITGIYLHLAFGLLIKRLRVGLTDYIAVVM